MSYFAHEKLDCYRLARDVARWMMKQRFPRGLSNLRDQARRSAASIALNIAEGCGRKGNARRNHYRIALASAAEACAVLDLVDLPQGAEMQQKLRRIGAMLAKMS